MALRLYNTLTRNVEPFIPLDPDTGAVTFYSCGPTVYDYAHIGNFRAFLVSDLLRRWLESPLCQRVDAQGEATGQTGYTVHHVMNLTDVGHMTEDAALDGGGEDRMVVAGRRLAAAKKSGALPAGAAVDPNDPYAIADFYIQAFKDDARVLGLKVVADADAHPQSDTLPRATAHIDDMLRIIASLLEKGCAYVASDSACYFNIESFPRYGALSGNTLARLRAGAGGRVQAGAQARKNHPADFLLWKPDPAHSMRWDPADFLGEARARSLNLREGYPGWHLECSAMALAGLAGSAGMIDIHSGGEDNIFPHHECEIAQSCCYTGAPGFARHWVHARHLFVEGAKMSKSAGNFFTLRDLLAKGFEPAAIRLELIRTHYRSNANFTEQGLRDATRMLERWRRFLAAAGVQHGAQGDAANASPSLRNIALSDSAQAARDAFTASFDDDLNIAGALGAINTWIGKTAAPGESDTALFFAIDNVLGVLDRPSLDDARGSLTVTVASAADSASRASGLTDAQIEALLNARTAARAKRDFSEADRIRDKLADAGVEIKDSPKGTTWLRTAKL